MRTITCAVFCCGAFVVALDVEPLDVAELDVAVLDVAVLDVAVLDVEPLDVAVLDVEPLDVAVLDVAALDVVGDELVLPRDDTVLVDVVGEVMGDPPHAAITKLAAVTNVTATLHRAKLFLLIITRLVPFRSSKMQAYLNRGSRINRSTCCRIP